jgi:hypothetical protein
MTQRGLLDGLGETHTEAGARHLWPVGPAQSSAQHQGRDQHQPSGLQREIGVRQRAEVRLQHWLDQPALTPRLR